MVTESEDFRLITTLFAVQLSDQSGLVRKVQAAEDLLCQYELLTTTNFACIKQNQGFGCAGKVFQTICKPSKEKRKRGGVRGMGVGTREGTSVFFKKSLFNIFNYLLIFTNYYHYCLLFSIYYEGLSFISIWANRGNSVNIFYLAARLNVNKLVRQKISN